ESCIWRARDVAAESLERAGLAREGSTLREEDDLGSLQTLAAARARTATGGAANALVYLADAVQVSRGGWFETYVGHPGGGATATPGAIAANVGFVAATAAGSAAADAAGRPEAFDDGWDAEREHQLAWLTETLDLDEL